MTETTEKVVDVQDEPVEDAEGIAFGELVDVEVTEEDIAEASVTADVPEVTEAVEEEEEIVPDVEDYGDDEDSEPVTTIPTGFIGFTYEGAKSGKSPRTVTLIVPDDGTAADDPTGVITSGADFTLRLGETAYGSEEQVAWLESHPAYEIKRT